MKVCETKRFDVFKYTAVRNPDLGYPRDVYLAFFREEDTPRPVCTVTIDNHTGYVEWVETAADHRRMGIATEVLKAVESLPGMPELVVDGATDEGEAFCDAYCAKAAD